jgi:hypothetical protein
MIAKGLTGMQQMQTWYLRRHVLGALLRGSLLSAWVVLWLGGCGGPLTAPPRPSAATAASPAVAFLSTEEALPGLVAAEREASIAGDLAMLETLWTPDARIIDGRNTATADDDYVWDGRDAILDRYVVAVFPNPPPAATFEDLKIDVNDQTATGHIQGDRWRFVFAEGRWWLAELTYQQP